MLTDRQKTILKFVTDAVRKAGRPPSYREIGRRFGIASTNGVRDHLLALERKGFLSVLGRRRGIELAPRTRDGVFSVPLVGWVPAGGPVVSDENVEEMLSLPEYFGLEGELFALRVRGVSMIGAGIMNGDTVVVRMQSAAEDGAVAVVLIDGEATVKRLYRRGPELILRPENPRMHEIRVPLESSEVRVVGKVVGLLRRF